MYTSHVTYECVLSHMNESCHIRMSHIIHMSRQSRCNRRAIEGIGLTHHTATRYPTLQQYTATHRAMTGMGWLRIVGSLKL